MARGSRKNAIFAFSRSKTIKRQRGQREGHKQRTGKAYRRKVIRRKAINGKAINGKTVNRAGQVREVECLKRYSSKCTRKCWARAKARCGRRREKIRTSPKIKT